MSPDDFEQKLKRVPFREIPAAWRQDILHASAADRSAAASGRRPRLGFGGFAMAAVRELIWSPRRVWAGFVVIWLILIAFNMAESDSASAGSRSTSAIMAWERQREVLAQMMTSMDTHDADKPKPLPVGPRSEREASWRIG